MAEAGFPRQVYGGEDRRTERAKTSPRREHAPDDPAWIAYVVD